MKKMIVGLSLGLLVLVGAPLMARDLPSGGWADSAAMAIAAQTAEAIPLRVQLVLSRYQGEKKLSSIPYTLSVVANDKTPTRLRMGIEVPVPAGPNSTSYTYRSVGTNIDCTARSTQPGVFKLDLTVEESSIFVTEKEGAVPPGRMSGMPAFRSFTSAFSVLLKDGQTGQHTSATDPVSGEVLRVDVTVNVVK